MTEGELRPPADAEGLIRLSKPEPPARRFDGSQRPEGESNPQAPLLELSKPQRRKFAVEPFDAIKFNSCEEWLVKRIIPRQGVGALYGASQSLKSFVAFHLALQVALGWELAGRRVQQAPAIYVAAEGAAGLRKRKVGFERANAGRLPGKIPFFLISAAPNLGTEQGDLASLIAAIEAAGVKPALIVVDTLAQSLGGADENGAGMVQFVANATALANHFRAFVLIVHHVGLADDKRLRGHSSLLGALDALILSERKEGELSAVLTLQKLKDDESNVKLTAHLSQIVIGQDEDSDDVSTLIVDRIEDGAGAETRSPSKPVPRSQRLLMDVVGVALDEAGEDFRPFAASGPLVRAVPDSAIRTRYYARIAEQAEPGEDKGTLIERQGKAFRRSIKLALEAKTLCAKERSGERLVWLP